MAGVINPVRLYCIGNAFYYKKNFIEAKKRYFLAAKEDHGPSQQMVGYMFQYGLGGPVNYMEAMSYYKKATENENIKAITSIGHMYERGVGVRQDYSDAYVCYRAAADKGEVHAMYNLGVLLENNYVESSEEDKAEKWYKKSAALGFKPSKINLENLEARKRKARKDQGKKTNSGTFDIIPSVKANISLFNQDINELQELREHNKKIEENSDQLRAYIEGQREVEEKLRKYNEELKEHINQTDRLHKAGLIA